MRYFCKHITCVALWILTAMGPAHLRAEEPILARLSFWVDPQRMGEFENAYEVKVVPFLEEHGLVESTRRGRATIDSVFSRLFELKELTDIPREKAALESDPEWQGILQELGANFSDSEEAIRTYWGAYRVPVGPGKAVVARPPSGIWRNLEIEGEKHQDITRAIVQDQEGYLWFSTNGIGAIRYDGLETSSITPEEGLADPIVTSIYQARDGAMWFGTLEGVSRCVGRECVTFTAEDGLGDNRVSVIFQQQNGDLWVGTEGGLSRYNGRDWTAFTSEDGLAGNDVWAISEDREGVLWFGTYGGVSRYDGREWTTFTTEDGLAHNKVRSISEDREGVLWFGTYGGVSRYDGREWMTFTTEDGLANDRVYSIFQDDGGVLWFGTYGGVSRYDGREWVTFTTEDGLVNDGVYSILQDDEGNFWFGTDQGACWYGGETIVRFTTEQGLPNDVIQGFHQDSEGTLWICTDGGGLSRYDGKTWTTLTVEDGLPENSVMGLSRDREGNFWFGAGGVGGEEGEFMTGGNGVVRYDGHTFSTLTVEDGLVSNWVWGIQEDREGNFWFSTNRGLSRYDGQRFENFTMEDGLPHNLMGGFYETSNGDLWFSSFGGLVRYDGENFVETLTTEDGLPSNWVLGKTEDAEGNLWVTSVGPTGGVSRYDGQNWTTFTTEDGLASTFIYSVFMDDKGDMWFGSNKGVNHYDGRVFQYLTAQDGLTNNHNTGVRLDGEGDFWFISNVSGMTRYRPPAPSPPGIVIDEVVADRSYERPAELSFPSTTVKTSFAFHGMSFKTRPGGMVYRYRLKGYDEDWRNTRERLVEYQDLPMGDYTFEVLAVDRDMAYSEEPATVILRVHPPYDRIGLIAALLVALSLAGWQTVRVVQRGRELRQSNAALSDANKELFGVNQDLQQKSEDLEKARVAAESANHAKSLFLANMSHEIRTPMNAILGYAQILQRSGDLNNRHRHAVETIHNSGDHLLNLINDVLDISKIEAGRMELVPEDFDLAELVRGLSVMFELQCREKGLGWRLEGLGEEKLPVHGDEAKVRQVLINLIGNGVKFTTEGEVVLRLVRREGDVYRFEVEDTGPGLSEEDRVALFQPFQQGESGMRQGGTGLGLTISQRQLGLMGSELEVESRVGEGSCFSFAIELPPAREEVAEEGIEAWSRVTGLAPGRRVRALVADDVAENREILSSMLGGIGVEVEVVENGKEALDRMEESLPDVVFLDIRMPVLDGLETLELVQEDERWRQVKVVAVSASVLDHERAEFLQAGFDDFLDKPFRFEDVCGSLAQHLGVEFVYGEGGEEESVGGMGDWRGISLPEDLVSGLVKAAEFYSVTEIEGYLQEMESLGEGERRLASHLRDLRRQHNMEGIIEILGTINHG